jgi:HlyD family secretion protein
MKNLTFILCVGLLLVTASCSSTAPLAAEPDPTLQANLNQHFQYQDSVEGMIRPEKISNLSFGIPGHIASIKVKNGDLVRTGDLLAALDTTQLQQAVTLAETDLAIAQASLEVVSAGPHPDLVTAAQGVVEAIEAEAPLTVSARAIQEAELKEAQARLDYLLSQPSAEEIALAEARLEKEQEAIADARLRLDLAELKAPFDGEVIQVVKRPYEFTDDGETVLRLGDPTSMIVHCTLSDTEVTQLEIGQTLDIHVLALPDLKITGTVVDITPLLDTPPDSNFSVTLTLHDIPEELRWGMMVNVVLP